ncbi:MAG: hypothetical protein KAT46_07615 [Deltaproteobacteria bacterium]|nr:hypothetical protein [Deltaproteobacteria bacterium]
MKRLIGYSGLVIIIVEFIAVFIAYFVSSFDPQTKTTYDGFGRELSESPWLIKLILEEGRFWAGWKWFVGDLVIFWSGIIIGFNFAKFGFTDKKQ